MSKFKIVRIRIILSLSLFLLIFINGCYRKERTPVAVINPVEEEYFGFSVTDPYRYMEDMDDTLFLNWMKEYAGFTRKILDEIPGRKGLMDVMLDFDSRKSDEISYLDITESDRYFYLKMTPEDETGKLYYRDGYEGNEVLLFDPETYAEDESLSYAISRFVPAQDGKYIIIAVAANGSESSVLLVMEVETGKFLPDIIESSMGSVKWICKGEGFVYTKCNSDDVHDPDRYLDMKVYYHSIGTRQEMDELVFSSEKYPELEMKPREIPYMMYDHDNETMFLALLTVEKYLKVFYAPCIRKSLGNIKWRALFALEDKVMNFYPLDDSVYLYSAKDAPGFQILCASLTHPDIENARVVVPEHENGILSGFDITNEALYYKLKFNGVQEKLYRIPNGQTKAEKIEFPVEAGSAWISTRGHKFSDIWITLSGWTLDGKRYRYNSTDGSFHQEELSSEAEFPEFEDLYVEELMIPSHDQVEVPLSLIYNKGTVLDGAAPLLITGYGAYGKSSVPYFSPYSLLWVKKGGILAVAHVRGGGELGDAWHKDGQKTSKPNTWKDMIACTQYLIDNNYSSPKHIAIYGGSAGGITVGRAITENPGLYAAAVPVVGVMNPLRIEESPNGPVNSTEFGTVRDSVECMALIEMDSYLNIDDGVDYPATLVTAGFNDPRVIVWQPAKFTARLQAASRNLVLFDVDYSSGHGVGDTKTKSFERLADVLAFSFWQCGHPEFQK